MLGGCSAIVAPPVKKTDIYPRYYINNNEIKKAGRSLKLTSIWWVGCEGMSQYIPPTEEQIRSW
jgi:hypothetical protein